MLFVNHEAMRILHRSSSFADGLGTLRLTAELRVQLREGEDEDEMRMKMKMNHEALQEMCRMYTRDVRVLSEQEKEKEEDSILRDQLGSSRSMMMSRSK